MTSFKQITAEPGSMVIGSVKGSHGIAKLRSFFPNTLPKTVRVAGKKRQLESRHVDFWECTLPSVIGWSS